ncbi:DNA adenine methylase [Megamonas rupellensis]|uniref:DNA adenine methylase n=1 Tax=Megamonas rupellensis TaxID=491921 RepID=UPI00195EBE91|nr:DNA adenine methylase [Megamonas rupellensis]
MKPIIKWPGGKSGEIKNFEYLIPKYDRYIEPFFGGGALFFHLSPQKALVNDISKSLINYYKLIKNQDNQLYKLLINYDKSFMDLLSFCNKFYNDILEIYIKTRDKNYKKENIVYDLKIFSKKLMQNFDLEFYNTLLIDKNEFFRQIIETETNKILRVVKLNEKKPLLEEDLRDNLITGFMSGYYMYFRKVYNDINLKRNTSLSRAYQVANFYFIREYCYGSMFRYNNNGEFNIPYGGISYNKKILRNKIENMFNEEIKHVFQNTKIYCLDFADFFKQVQVTENDFIFLDPPYDTDFSDYENRQFTKDDQIRLANELKKIKAKFILVIKNTDFIRNLYENNFNIISFDNTYTYNVRGRNTRDVEHLIITNIID